MLLAAFVWGLIGVLGMQCLSNLRPSSRLSIAPTVEQAEKQKRFNESFILNSIKHWLLSRSPDRDDRGEDKSINTHANKQKYRASRSSGKFTWNAQTKTALRCYECQGIGHYGRECSRLRRESQNTPRKKKRSGRSRRSHSPGDKPTNEPKRGGTDKNHDQRN